MGEGCMKRVVQCGVPPKEPLNKSLVGATVALQDEMRERQQREWCDRGERSSVFRRKMRPRSGMLAPQGKLDRGCGTRRCPIPLSESLERRPGVPLRCASWYRSPSYDLRRAPRDHPDFDSTALCRGFVQRLPKPCFYSLFLFLL
jgi:hypothetical protein